jgi:hypothetical protein
VGRSPVVRRALLVGAVAVVPLLAGCGGAVTSSDASAATPGPSSSAVSPDSVPPSPSDEPGVAAPVPSAPAPSASASACREPGASTGPAAGVAAVRLALPASGAGGSTLGVSTSVVVRSDAPRIVLQPAVSGLVVLRGGTVVASAAGHGVAVPLPLRAGATMPAQVVPEALPLIGCDGAPLPAGRYTVRAVVGYGGDPLNAGAGDGAGRFQLVSPAVPLTVS